MIEIPKHKPPSRIRYEQNHPAISFRLDRELKKRLEEMLEGKSFADFVKEGLGVRERERKSLETARSNGYKEGLREGIKKATDRYGVYTICAICGEEMLVRAPGLKEALNRFIQKQGWGHEDCMEEAGLLRR